MPSHSKYSLPLCALQRKSFVNRQHLALSVARLLTCVCSTGMLQMTVIWPWLQACFRTPSRYKSGRQECEWVNTPISPLRSFHPSLPPSVPPHPSSPLLSSVIPSYGPPPLPLSRRFQLLVLVLILTPFSPLTSLLPPSCTSPSFITDLRSFCSFFNNYINQFPKYTYPPKVP